MSRYRSSRVDKNHSACLDAARSIGMSVHDTHDVGGGFPDFTAAAHGTTWLCEVKDPSQPWYARKLTKPEVEFAKAWKDPAHHVVVGCAHCIFGLVTSIRCDRCGIAGPIPAVDYAKLTEAREDTSCRVRRRTAA